MSAPLLQAILRAPWLLPILPYIILLCIQFGDCTTYKFILYNLSKVMLSVNFSKVLLYLYFKKPTFCTKIHFKTFTIKIS